MQMLTKVILAGTALYGGKYLLDERKKAKAKKKKAKAGVPQDYLSGLFSPGATLAAAPGVVADVEKPIVLQDVQMRDADGNIHDVRNAAFMPDGSWNTSDGADVWNLFSPMRPVIGTLVTNLYGPGAEDAYGRVLDAYIAGAEQPVDAAIAVLNDLRPQVDWAAVAPGSAEEMVGDGVLLLAEIAKQNLPGA